MKVLKQALEELKQNYGVVGLRTDMSSEVISEQEFDIFKKLSEEVGLKYAIKVGGCDALTDIYHANKAGADSIICPMIESKYALQKFIDNCKLFYENLNQINLFLVIESSNAYNNLDSILTSQDIKFINGIVLGRNDMVKSLSLNTDDINSDEIFNICINVANSARKHNKIFVLGGGIRPNASMFLKKLSENYLINYETRRIIFDSNTLNKTNFNKLSNRFIQNRIEKLKIDIMHSDM